jgi:hypothetical protein
VAAAVTGHSPPATLFPEITPIDSQMKSKTTKPIDKLLAELALHRATMNPDASPTKALIQLATTNYNCPCEKTRYSSEAKARKAGHRIMKHGANTTFFRSYFCPDCKAWHLTSSKNLGSSKSSQPKRNASRRRRKHQPTPYADES